MVGEAQIHVRIGGSGPPLLLLHGYPQNHLIWDGVAERLSGAFTIIATDLRGYGDSLGPHPEPSGANYTFREMALDQIGVMNELGIDRFYLAGHDRGARTADRLALDHPDRVERLALLDILPTHFAWTQMPPDVARRAWHWILCAQPHDLAETLMTSVPAEWLMDRLIPAGPHGKGAMSGSAYRDYLRCLTPTMIAASCADYRAFATIDVDHDQTDLDAGRRLECPVLTLWGQYSLDRADMLDIWRRYAANVTGKVVAGAGHYLPEEAPDAVSEALLEFFS